MLTTTQSTLLEPHIAAATPEGLEEVKVMALEAASSLVPERLQSFISTSLSLGATSPALQFFESLLPASEACATGLTFIVTPGRSIQCSVYDALIAASAVEASADIPEAEDWEHERKGSSGSSKAKVILHGAIGTSSFCSAHKQLSAAVEKGEIVYSLRHHSAGMPVVEKSTQLKGYGVFLDIKNMEYKNVDDRKASTEEDATSSPEDSAELPVFQEDETVNGVVFSTLLKRAPALHAELKLLRETFIDSSAADKDGQIEMKVWKMKDLGLQTLQVCIVN